MSYARHSQYCPPRPGVWAVGSCQRHTSKSVPDERQHGGSRGATRAGWERTCMYVTELCRRYIAAVRRIYRRSHSFPSPSRSFSTRAHGSCAYHPTSKHWSVLCTVAGKGLNLSWTNACLVERRVLSSYCHILITLAHQPSATSRYRRHHPSPRRQTAVRSSCGLA